MASEDADMWDGDQAAYFKLLTDNPRADDADQDSSSDDDDDDDEQVSGSKSNRAASAHPLIMKPNDPDTPSSKVSESCCCFHGVASSCSAIHFFFGWYLAQVARWFSDPIFEGLGSSAAPATAPGFAGTKKNSSARTSGDNPMDGEDEEDDEGDGAEIMHEVVGIKTDKQLRSEKRMKGQERRARIAERKAAKSDEPGLEIVGSGMNGSLGADVEEGDEGLDPEERARIQKKRKLIQAGMGAALNEGGGASGGGYDTIEIAPKAGEYKLPRGMPARMDNRPYDSDAEDYDSDDQMATLALGTMMLRKSRAKKMIDASYNRYAWNDPSDLPDWFVDDETEHYRPQLPIPKALMDQIRQKQQDLASKPIAKVAEARARKRKRAQMKLKAAKKQAEQVANAPDMSEKEKLRAVQKAMKQGAKEANKPSKSFVVAKKSNGGALLLLCLLPPARPSLRFQRPPCSCRSSQPSLAILP